MNDKSILNFISSTLIYLSYLFNVHFYPRSENYIYKENKCNLIISFKQPLHVFGLLPLTIFTLHLNWICRLEYLF